MSKPGEGTGSRGLYWARCDLRFHDNQALKAFCEDSQEGLVAWAPTSSYLRAGTHRKAFIEDCVYHFKNQLAEKGLHFLVLDRPASVALPALVEHYQINRLFFTREFAFDEVKEEVSIEQDCEHLDVEIRACDQSTLIHESDLPFSLENMPRIFTDFRKKIESNLRIRVPVSAPSLWPQSIPGVTEEECPTHTRLQSEPLFYGGEHSALDRIDEYFWKTDAIRTYKETRNGLLHFNDSSKLSPWLSQGALSPRRVYEELKRHEAERGANDSTYWLFFELLWRDYFKFLSRKEKRNIFLEKGLSTGPFSSRPLDEQRFQKWREGTTGDAFIDANMRELNATGFMSNRGRQNVASYLIHDLKQPWVAGARYFESQLIDYDPDVNWGNWLYLSGQGTDPRSRVFNIEKQANQYDPDGLYRKKWL